MKYFRLIWKNVFRKKLRTTLTASSIVLVLVLIVILTSLLQAMQADPSGGRGSNRLVVQHATGLGNFLPISQRQRIEQIPGVVAVSPQIWFGGVYKDDKPENWIGQLSCDPEIYFDKVFDDATIDPGVKAEWKATRNGFVAGQKIADKFKWKKGDHIILRGTYIPINLDLVYVGPFSAGDETNIFFHNEYLNQSKWFGADKYTGIYYLKVASGEDVPRVAAAIDSDVREQRRADEDPDREAVPAPVHGDDGQRQVPHQRHLAHHPLRRDADRGQHGRDVGPRARHGDRRDADARLRPRPHPRLHPLGIGADVAPRRTSSGSCSPSSSSSPRWSRRATRRRSRSGS